MIIALLSRAARSVAIAFETAAEVIDDIRANKRELERRYGHLESE